MADHQSLVARRSRAVFPLYDVAIGAADSECDGAHEHFALLLGRLTDLLETRRSRFERFDHQRFHGRDRNAQDSHRSVMTEKSGAVHVIIVMGVSGAGKTTVGTALAAALDWAFYEGDDFHPPRNIALMAARHALTDADRVPWLAALRELIVDIIKRGDHGVIACSALRHAYRRELAGDEG